MDIEAIVAIISIFVGSPALVFAFILGLKFLKIREKELELRQRELLLQEEEAELQRQELEYKLRMLEDSSGKE